MKSNYLTCVKVIPASIFFCVLPMKASLAGGYVDGSVTLDPATTLSTSTSPTPTFNNAQFTNKILVGTVNNNPVKTPSTTDPVSTVSGNNYHDESDFRIHGRNGLDYVFTRTYNSGPSATAVDSGLGFGWVHSYGMKLVSNNFGVSPNGATTTTTGSITYTDERGGQQNFLVSATTSTTNPPCNIVNTTGTYPITNPCGVFDTLTVNPGTYTVNGRAFTLSAGQYAMTFLNGVQYLFQDPTYSTSSDMRTVPGKTARLIQISDPFGNQINLTYTGNNLTGIADNLGVSGRTGLVLAYNADSPVNHLTSVTDWSGRKWQYNVTSGNLTSYTNPLSQTLTYQYKTGHLLTQVIKPLQRNGVNVASIFNYYANGRVFNDQDSLGNTETLDYDLFRQRTRVTDPNGNVREYDYDSYGNMIKMVNADGGILFFNNQSDGLRYQKYDALGYSTQYSYNSANTYNTASNTSGNVSQETDYLNSSTGYTTSYTYGIYAQIASVTDKNGNTLNTSYYTTTGTQSNKCDVTGKPNTVSIAVLGGSSNVNLRTYCWNSDGTLAGMTEYPGTSNNPRVTILTYDTAAHLNVASITINNQTSSKAATMSIVTNYLYDNLGRKTSESINRTSYAEPLSATSTTATQTLTNKYQYDALDRVTQTTTPDGILHQTVFDANGQVYQQISGYPGTMARTGCAAPASINGTSYVLCTEATFAYDAADRKISVTDIQSNVSKYAYDNNSNLLSVTDPNGHTTQYQYDSMNRQTAVINANGQTTNTTFDLDGHATAVTDANGNTITSKYDAFGRVTQVSDALDNTTSYQYDANGNKTCMIDANANSSTASVGHQPVNANTGCTVKYVYDQLNRLTQTIDAINTTTSGSNNHATTYTFNLYGAKLSVTDANNAVTSYSYDDLGRMTQMTDPLSNIESYVNDETGNVIEKKDRKGQVFLYAFDSMNRKIQTLNEADNTLKTRVYDPSYGDQLQSENSHITYTFTYDNKHRKLSKTDSRLNKTLNWSYDPAGNIKTKIDYQGDTTNYQHDNSNKLVAETNSAYLEMSYHYDNAGRLEDRILSNGARTHYVWDNGNRLTQLQNTTVTGQTVNNTTYIRDALGNILTATEATGASQVAGQTTYSYDADYRLLSAGYPTAVSSLNESFTYDAVGNRKTYTKGGTTYYYNRVAGSNRLKNQTIGSTTGTVYKSYAYDNNGNLSSISGNRNIGLSWTGNNKVSLISLNGIPSLSFQYDPKGYRIVKSGGSVSNYYLEKGKLEAIYDNAGNLQAKYMRGSVIDEVVNGYQLDANNNLTNYSFHHDNLQSVLGQSSHDGNVLAAQGYTAFGNIINATGSSNNILKYTGREQDIETGLYYYNARYLDPLTGMMLSEDPMRFGAGINWYIYANQNPVNVNDPTGYRPLTDGEVGILTPIFNNSLNYSNIDIQNGPGLNAIAAIANAQGRSITIGNTIYMASDDYSSDYSASPMTLSGASILPHEVTHVWQNKNEDGFIGTAAGSIADNLTMGSAAYQYTLNPSEK